MKSTVHANRKHGISRPHPRKDFKDRIELYQYRRGPDNPTWDARFKIESTWTGWTSLATTEWDDAVFIAIEKLVERENATKAGIQIVGRKRKEANTVAEIAMGTIARLRTEQVRIMATPEFKKAHVFTAKIANIESKLLPAFGDRGIANLTEDDLERFRLSVTVKNGTPKRSTIANINSAWLEVLNDAVTAGYLSRVRKRFLVISQAGFGKGQRGDAFSRAEMQMIRNYMSDAWIASGHTAVSRENRLLLRALVSLMSCTGLTPGLETELVTPHALREVADTHGHPAIRVEIRKHQGKRAPDRVVWARTNDVWPVVDDMRQLRAWIKANASEAYQSANPSGYLFCRPSDGEFPIFHRVFEEVLESLRIRVDPVTKVNRRLYSCRHYYATQALQDGVEVAFVAKNMGTSERMIHEHYEHIITDLRSGVLTGSRIGVRAMTDVQRRALREELDRIENDPDDHLLPEERYR